MEVTYALGVRDADAGGRRQRPLRCPRPSWRRRSTSGRALETFGRIIEAQGGNRSVIEDPAILPQAGAVEVFRAPRGGVVSAVEPRRIGRGILELGGGRLTMEDRIDPSVGFVITVKPGDDVRAGDPVASVFARDDAGVASGLAALGEAIVIGDAGKLAPLISHRITSRGVENVAAPR